MIGIAVLALGTGPLFALGTGLVLGSVPPERAGSAASMSETGNYFGGSLGFALLGVVAAVVYRSRMDGTSDSLAGAVAASRHLPASQGAELLHTAREAFTASLHVTGVVAAVIFAGLAVLILTMRPAPGPPRPHCATTRRLTHRTLPRPTRGCARHAAARSRRCPCPGGSGGDTGPWPPANAGGQGPAGSAPDGLTRGSGRSCRRAVR
jgi:MFS family permease